ncbi:MAG: hypothetical protein JXO51_08030 [Candidatus Aminicenantes bacterium]|nr:hypothetical protein [Candidatus Aminicenantes bacterium]
MDLTSGRGTAAVSDRRRGPLLMAADAAGAAALALAWLLGDGGLFFLLAIAAVAVAGERAWGFLSRRGPTPYLGMLASPLLLLHYSSIGDFRVRLACFVMLLYVLALAARPPRSAAVFTSATATPRRAWLLSLLAFFLAATGLYIQGIQLSGDEPHYVMIAQSLVEDGDLDLKNNVEERSYLDYLPVEIRFHGMVHDGRYRSFHLPGVSFLLLPFYLLYRLLGGAIPGALFFRLAAALINSFFALGLFLVLRAAWPQRDNRRLFLFFLLTFPLLFHAVHLFPELPAATLVIFAYLSARKKRRYFLSGLFLAAAPWLHLKYALPVLALALFVLAWIWRDEPRGGARWRRLAAFLAAPALSLALLGLYSRLLYGSFDPRVISPERNFSAIPLKFQVETLLSFFLDQRDGLLVVAPVFLLVFLAFKKRVRSSVRDFALLASLAVPYVLFHAYTTVRGGYSPLARPLVFCLWIMIVLLAALYRATPSGSLRSLFRLLAGMTAFASVWFLYYPLFLYQPVTRQVTERASSWLRFMSSEAIDLASFFPSFLKRDNSAYLPNGVWLAALAVALLLYYSPFQRPLPPWMRRAAPPLLGLALLFLFCGFPHVRLQNRYAASGLSFFCSSRNFAPQHEAEAFRARAGQDYDLFFDLKGSAADELNLLFFNLERTALRVRNGRTLLMEAAGEPQRRLRLSLRGLKGFSLAGRSLVHLGLETTAMERGAVLGLKLE